MGHDMTPVAGRIANGQQNWPVFAVGLLKGRCAPRVPLNRIMGMLQQVWAGLIDEGVARVLVHASGYGHAGQCIIDDASTSVFGREGHILGNLATEALGMTRKKR